MSTYQSQQGALHCSQFQNNVVHIQSGTHDTASQASTHVKEMSTGLSCQFKNAWTGVRLLSTFDSTKVVNNSNVVDDSNTHSSNGDGLFHMQA